MKRRRGVGGGGAHTDRQKEKSNETHKRSEKEDINSCSA